MIRVLALASYPLEAAATRFRLVQFVEPLKKLGIAVEVRPFLDAAQFGEMYASRGPLAKGKGLFRSIAGRVAELPDARNFDCLLVQREAMFFGPAIFEWLHQRIGRMPMVLDLDDATYVRYVSPKYGRLGSLLKFFGKTDKLIDRAATVICGNRFIAEYVTERGGQAIVIPTVVDTELFEPKPTDNEVPVIGWIGTHSTYPFVRKLFPVFQELAAQHRFILRIIGSGVPEISIDGVDVENLEWDVDREISDFQSFDIGLYPMHVTDSADSRWLAGKSGFKAIQYLAVGVPFVMTPVGVCAEIGVDGETHFNAGPPEEWYNHLDRLLKDADLRRQMGAAGRRYSVGNYALEPQAERIADVIKKAVDRARRG